MLYYGLKYLPKEDRKRAIESLNRLRGQLSRELPSRTRRDSLMLATWNIRDFGGSRLNPSPRLAESLYYMAEIISAFDLVAVQEVNENMQVFEKLMDILGPTWNYIATDVCEGRAGNGERMVFIYDIGKVLFRNIAGEVVLPTEALVEGKKQFARTPFLVKFQCGWCRFSLCTVHLYYGSDSGPQFEQRVAEIDKIAGFLAKRAEREQDNYILLGDMNIVDPRNKTMEALKKHDFVLPGELAIKNIPDAFLGEEFASNMNRDKYYDQIAFYSKRNELELGKSPKKAGVFNYYDTVFRPEDWEVYYDASAIQDKWGETAEARKKYFTKQWRTWQMSDHLPLWTEINIDFTERYLKKIAGD
jgi:endonuclease/exonuclease/phosphatase family metal-dependent hydrolase